MILRIIIFSVFAFQLIINITRPIITLYASNLGSNTFEIGILTAAFAFFPLLFALQAGRIADKYGDRYPVIFGMIGLAVGMFFPYFFTTIWALYISQFIVGISNIFIAVSLQNVIGNIATESNRDQYFSMFGMAVAAASLIGPILGGYISEHYNYNSVFLVSLLLAIFPIFISFKVPAIKKDVSEKKSIIESIGLLKIPLLKKALFSSALVLYSKDIFVAYFPILAKEADLSNSQIGARYFLTRISNDYYSVCFTKTSYTNEQGLHFIYFRHLGRGLFSANSIYRQSDFLLCI